MQLDGEPRLLWIQGAACVRSFWMAEVAFCIAPCTVPCQVRSLRRRVEELEALLFAGTQVAMGLVDYIEQQFGNTLSST